MTMPPLVVRYQDTAPTVQPGRDVINESIMVIGTAEAGQANLPANTPYLINRLDAIPNPPGRTLSDAQQRDGGSWHGVYDAPQTFSLWETLDQTVREILTSVQDDVIVVRIEAADTSTLPTDVQINAAIAGAASAITKYSNTVGLVLLPYYAVQRDGTSPFAATTPPTAGNAWLDNLDSLAVNLGGTAVIGGDASYSVTDAIAWAGFSRHPDTVAVWPAVQGSVDPASHYAMSVLRKEAGGSGRGVSLNYMQAVGVNNTVPSISQSRRDSSADTNRLNAAGITTLYRGADFWRFQGVTTNVDLAGGIDLQNNVVSVERLKYEFDQLLDHYAEVASDLNVSTALADFIVDSITAEIDYRVANGRIAGGSITPSTPFVTNTTEVNFDFIIQPFAPATTFRFTGTVQAPTIG